MRKRNAQEADLGTARTEKDDDGFAKDVVQEKLMYMKCKVTRTQNGFAIEVPAQAQLEEGEAEFFESFNGTCIIVAQRKRGGVQAVSQNLMSEENALLKKLSAIKFEERT